MAGLVRRQKGKKPTGCMPTFLQIFDRQQILAGKRIHSIKRLPPSTGVGASPETVSSGDSQEFTQELEKPERKKHAMVMVPANSECSQSSPARNGNSRRISPAINSTVDEDDNQSRPQTVIARLMGLEPLTSSDQKPPVTVKSPAVQRSIQVVRTNYIDDNNFQLKHPNKSQKQSVEHIVRNDRSNGCAGKLTECALEDLKSESLRISPRRSRSFVHSADFFPEPNQTTVIMGGDFEKKLKMRGMDEHLNDLAALKQILEGLQLKGLLHPTSNRNFVCDRNLHSDDHVNQWRSFALKLNHHRSVNDSRGARRHASKNLADISPKPNGGAVDRSCRIPVKVKKSSSNRIESNLKSCNSIIKRKPLSIEILSPIDSPKHTPKKPETVHHSVINLSPRNQKPTESSSINSPNHIFIKNIITDDESQRSKWEGCIDGKSLLERCDKLLHSVSEMNSSTKSPPSSTTVLPSPVSVLDSRFDNDDSSSSSHSIDFKAPTVDLENWSPKISPTKSTEHEEITSHDPDFIYISKLLQSSQDLHEDTNLFFSIEKHLYDTESISNVSKCHRKLVFDVIIEILGRRRQLPPWKSSIEDSKASVKQIWSEFRKIREINTGDCLSELIGVFLKKDLVEIKDWGNYPIELSEAILEVERMIFKDIISETIVDQVKYSSECVFSRTRRRLVF